MKKLIRSIITILILSPLTLNATPKAAYIWNQIDDGFNYTKFSFEITENERTTIHAFQIDPKKFRFDVVTAKDEVAGSTAERLAKRNRALLVINGGFFTPEHKSIGLLVKNGKQINPIHKTSWWSIFTMRNDKPSIIRPNQFRITSKIDMALQVGPRLVVNGKIPKLKESFAIRSAVGITREGEVVIVITSGHGISMNELARRMKNSLFQGGLYCYNAMALDGGSSSQIYVKNKKFEFSQPGFVKVTNGLAVFKKRQSF